MFQFLIFQTPYHFSRNFLPQTKNLQAVPPEPLQVGVPAPCAIELPSWRGKTDVPNLRIFRGSPREESEGWQRREGHRRGRGSGKWHMRSRSWLDPLHTPDRSSVHT